MASPKTKRKRFSHDLMDVESDSSSPMASPSSSPSMSKRRKSSESKHNIIAKIKKIVNQTMNPIKPSLVTWLQRLLREPQLGGIL